MEEHYGGALGLIFTASTRRTPMSEVGVEAGSGEGWCGAPGEDADRTYPRTHALAPPRHSCRTGRPLFGSGTVGATAQTTHLQPWSTTTPT
jgi:hypothetical protein